MPPTASPARPSPALRLAAARRPVIAAALLYAALAVIFVSPGLIPGRTLAATDYLWSAAPWAGSAPAGVRSLGANYELADSVTQFQPFLQWTRDQLPGFPLWNPAIGAGRPFLADMQSAVLSPFSWPAYVLPFWWSLAVSAALKLWVAALGTFLLARALGMREAGALLAGGAFAFGLWFVTWLAWPLDNVWAWLPWLLLAVDRVIGRPGPRPVAALALAVGLQFVGGHPESSFHVLVAAALFALLRLSRRPAAAWARPAARLAAGALAGAGLAAIVLLPFAELLAHSADLAARDTREPVHVAPRYVLGLALPEYWGRPTGTVIDPFINARAWYVGALPLMLAGIALLRPTRERLAVAAAAAVSLAVATGIPPFFAIANHVPGFAQSHNTRLGVLVALGLALLAGWGLEDVRRRAPGARARALTAAVLVVPVLVPLARGTLEPGRLGGALDVAWGFATPPPLPAAATVVPMAAVLVWIPLALAAAALIWARARIGPGAFAAAALALVALDLLRVGMGQNPAIPVDHAKLPVTPAIRYLQQRPHQRFVGVARSAVVAPLPPDVAMRYGLEDARAYDYPVEKRYAALWARAIAKPDPFGLTGAGAVATATPSALRALGLLGVWSVLAPPHDPAPPGTRLAYAGRDARIYANPHAVPRAFLVGAQRVTDAPLAAVTAPGFDPRATAVTERRLPGLGATAGRSAGSATVRRLDLERMTVAVAATRPALLVTSDVYLPGWKATIDGHAAPVRRVDYLLRGVVVRPGRHTVELRYAPWSWTAGWVVSLLCALGLAVAAMWESARRWRS